MKIIKKLLPLLIYLSILFGAMPAYASQSTTVSMQIDNPIMVVNGVDAEIDPNEGTAPVIIADRTLIPIRAVIESFGGTVLWDGATSRVTLRMGNDTIILTINSPIAYFNNTKEELDVSPQIINDRTMLPIRYVSERFGLSVNWIGETRTVVISNNATRPEFSYENVPSYDGTAYAIINNNMPYFTEDEISAQSFELYSSLDHLGRCGECVASIGVDTMPTTERDSISSVKPSGWQSIEVPTISGGYLYNRCHLIGYQLTAENANPRNLITGTRYLNIEGMLPFENMVADYVTETKNHVMYRATPIFLGNELIARGVLLEGLSVEDNGAGIKFCVWCYNLQPDIEIDYLAGFTVLPSDESNAKGQEFLLNVTSKKFHIPSCSSVKRMKESNKKHYTGERDSLIGKGYLPCKICNP